MSVIEAPLTTERVALVDLIDGVLNGGVVINGDITLAVDGIDLVYLGLRVLLSSVATIERQLESAW